MNDFREASEIQPERPKDLRWRWERNAANVKRYIELWPLFERSSQISEEPFDRKHKGESRPVVSDTVLALMEANRDASLIILPLLDDLQKTSVEYEGILFSELLADLRYNPSLMRRWRNPLTAETAEDKLYAEALEAMCSLVARTAMAERDTSQSRLELRVVTRPEDEEARAKTNQARGKERTHDKESSYRLIGAEIEQVMKEEDCNLTAAKGLVAQRIEKRTEAKCSWWRTHDAWLFYSREQRLREEESA